MSTCAMRKTACFPFLAASRSWSSRSGIVQVRQLFTRRPSYPHVICERIYTFANLYRVQRHGQPQARLFSAATAGSTPISLKNLVKPFLLQCHPDVHTTPIAKTVNLKAIQNLNAYLDTLQSMASAAAAGQHTGSRRQGPQDSLVEIDFIMVLPETSGKTKKEKSQEPPVSRRSVQLALPPADNPHQQHQQQRLPLDEAKARIHQHGMRQIAKLLRVAGLKLPASALSYEGDESSKHDQHLDYSRESSTARPHYQPYSDLSSSYGSPQKARDATSFYAQSRRRFMRRLNTQKLERAYQRALADWQADYETADLYKHPANRRAYLAQLLSRCRSQPSVSVDEQWIAMRRLSLLLDEHFEKLELNSRLWDTLEIVLGPARDYNVGTTALVKRKRRQQDSGFTFRLLQTTTKAGGVDDRERNRAVVLQVEIPVDFGDEELVQELEANLDDFHDMMTNDAVDDNEEDIFWKAVMNN